MSVIWFILLALAFIALLVLIIWLLSVIFIKREEGMDNPLALNFLSKRGEGNFLVEEISREKVNNRHVVKVLPKDLPHNFNGLIKDEDVIVDTGKLQTCPKGSLSKYRNINWYLPANLDDIDSSIKDTSIGLGLLFMSQLEDVKKTVEDILREGTMRRDELLKKIGDGEISKEFLITQEELTKSFLERIANPKEKEKTNPLNLSAATTV